MNREDKPTVASDPLPALAQFLRTLQLVWRLLSDPRVPVLPKLVIPAAILYVLSPIDLIPDLILGLGQIDDVAIIFLSIRLFIDLCPPSLVEEHRRALNRVNRAPSSEQVVEGTYRIVRDDEPSEQQLKKSS